MLVDEKDWLPLFDAIKSTVLEEATKPQKGLKDDRDARHASNKVKVQADLDKWKSLSFDGTITDEEFWRRFNLLPFFTGKASGPIESRRDAMTEALSDVTALAGAEWQEGGFAYNAYLNRNDVLANPKDLKRVLVAARRIVLDRKNNPGKSMMDLYVREGDLRWTFDRILNSWHIGTATTLHTMMDLGLSVVKPDRALNRVAVRLGLVTSYTTNGATASLKLNITRKDAEALSGNHDYIWALQDALREMSKVTGYPMRLIDFLLVKLGATANPGSGYEVAICSDTPKCQLCGAQPYCAFAQTYRPKAKAQPGSRASRPTAGR